MSFFPRGYFADDTASFTPLFRLLDEFENYTGNEGRRSTRRGRTLQSFTPKFDVKEVDNAYELHGELPGIDQKDVEIEFSDDQTLTIKGRTERSYSSGTPPAGFIEGGAAPAAITEGEHKTPHKATVEDEDASKQTGVVKKSETPAEPEAKYWISERSVGEFSRSFTFPVRVDQEAVKASMKNGILSLIVPKAKKAESRKITIS
jgi:HSP20 family molecular chaperone IbpA